MREKLIEIISDIVVQNRFKLLLCKSLSPVEEASVIADHLIAKGVTILPEGAMVLTKRELDALKEYGKRRKNEE
jgi:hypothetical protein